MKGANEQWLKQFKRKLKRELRNKEAKVPNSMPMRKKIIYKGKKKKKGSKSC